VAGLTGAELAMIRGHLEVCTHDLFASRHLQSGARGQLLDLLQVLLGRPGPGCKRLHAVAPPNTTATRRSGLRALCRLVRLMV
jgi:hypothetical protein